MLSRGEYLGDLYDIGFDRPESHAIRKDGQMYYAFYARHWNGTGSYAVSRAATITLWTR